MNEPTKAPDERARNHDLAQEPKSRPRLFVAAPGRFNLEAAPWLARRLRMDVWGTSLLSPRARAELAANASIALFVFLFELIAWTVLFNVIVQGAQWRLSAVSLVALLLGFMFSGVVFLFERSVLTLDTQSSQRLWLSYSVRLVVIITSAFATASPIELIVFGHEIDERLQKEAILDRALEYRNAYQKAVQDIAKEPLPDAPKPDPALLAQVTTAAGKVGALQAILENKVQRKAEADSALKRAEQAVKDARRDRWKSGPELQSRHDWRVTKAQATRDAAQSIADEADRALPGAKAMLEAAKEEHEVLQKRLDDADRALVDERTTWKAKVESEQKSRRERTEQRLVDYRSRIERIRTLKPGQSLTEDDFDPYKAGFVRRISVLRDLISALPPAWPPSDAEAKEDATTLFLGTSWQSTDKESLARMERLGDQFWLIYLATFLIACVIPMLTIAFKLLQSVELKTYFSLDAQAEAGHPDAAEVRRLRYGY